MTTAPLPPRFERLLPRHFAESIAEDGGEAFAQLHGSSTFLLVELPPGSELLLAGLMSTIQAPHAQAGMPALAFDTVVADLDGAQPRAASDDQRRLALELRRRFSRECHFAAVLGKRGAGGAYQTRISVGRARNQDIVLRHHTVSKHHAYFTTDDAGALTVTDAGSTNGTRVGGAQVAARAPVPAPPGTVIHFGSVLAVVCDPATLIAALV